MDEVDLPAGGWLAYTVTGTRAVAVEFTNKAQVTLPDDVSDPLADNNSDSVDVAEAPIGGQPGLYYANFIPVVQAK